MQCTEIINLLFGVCVGKDESWVKIRAKLTPERKGTFVSVYTWPFWWDHSEGKLGIWGSRFLPCGANMDFTTMALACAQQQGFSHGALLPVFYIQVACDQFPMPLAFY